MHFGWSARALVVLLAAPVAACGGEAPAPTNPAASGALSAAAESSPKPAVTTQLTADTPMKSPSGASFEGPKSWFVTQAPDATSLENPEHDLTLRLVEVPNQTDATAAIETAWKKVKPDFARKVKLATHPPAKDGWDAVTQIVYETGSDEQRTVIALAQQKGTTQYVALIEGTNAGLDRRGAQLMTVISTFKAPGVEEESFKGRTAHTLDEGRIKLFDQFIEDARTRSHVPGMAIAVIQDGKVVFTKGYGVRELGKKDAVTPSTLFMIGSTSKSLTTLMMAKLVDENKFTWDTPVKDLLPTFALADADVTPKLLMKHTVCACTGLPRQDMELLFEYDGVTPEQRVDGMKKMKLTTGFGETFQYSNTMVATGGFVAAHAASGKKALGPAYDETIQSRVFGPLGMKSTTDDFSVAITREHASPHGPNIRVEYGVMPLKDEEGVVSVRPAGAIWSSVTDMSRYLMLELNKGRDDKGNQIVSEANLLHRREPQIKITDKLSYGLGLFLENDHGTQIVHHGGNNLGFTSDMYFLPEHGVGVVLLTNAGDANVLRKIIRRRLLEILFDARDEAAQSFNFALTREHESLEKELQRVSFEPEEKWANDVSGTYQNENLGKIVLTHSGKNNSLDAGEWKSGFGQQKEEDGTFKVVLLDPPLAGLDLRTGTKDGKKTLTLEAGQQTYVFEEKKK